MSQNHLSLIDSSGISWPKNGVMALYEIRFQNGKRYFGITNNPQRRAKGHWDSIWFGRKYRLYNAMRKHGLASLAMKVIAVGQDSYISDLEIAAIATFKTMNIAFGYNALPGGDINPMKDEKTREKMRRALTGRKYSEEAKALMRASWSPERRSAMGLVHKGKILSKEHREAISKFWKSWPKKQKPTKIKIPMDEIRRRMRVSSAIRWERTLGTRMSAQEARGIWLDKSISSQGDALARMSGWGISAARRNFGPRGCRPAPFNITARRLIIFLRSSYREVAKIIGVNHRRIQRFAKRCWEI